MPSSRLNPSTVNVRINSDINTPFNSTPYPGAAQAHTSEFNFSGRQSRLGGLFDGNTGPFKLSGYVEADFLSAGITSNENQTNSYTLRQRQIWGQIATKSGFAITGGQMWSLVTETKKGTDNRTENLPNTIDPQYHVGFSWARQPGLRFQQKFWRPPSRVAMSLEEAQIHLLRQPTRLQLLLSAARAPAADSSTPRPTTPTTSRPTSSSRPPSIRKYGHFEIGGLARFFRDRYYPGVTSDPATRSQPAAANDTKIGGGVFANARVPVTQVRRCRRSRPLAAHGVGRYGSRTLPDATVHPNGTLAPIKATRACSRSRLTPAKKLDLYGYCGGEYAQRTVYLNSPQDVSGRLRSHHRQQHRLQHETVPTANSGVGTRHRPRSPANCAGVTRAIHGRHRRLHLPLLNSPKYGKLQYQLLQLPHPRRPGQASGGLTQGNQQHGLHRHALLHPINLNQAKHPRRSTRAPRFFY